MSQQGPLSVNSLPHSQTINPLPHYITKIKRSDFNKSDEKFLFGSATAAYQVEGGFADGGKGLSIWDTYTLDNPGLIKDGTNGNVAIDNYNLFKEDVKLMKKTGLDAYRFSISWPRVLPGGKLTTGVNRQGIKFYNDLIDTLLEAGIEPCVTLFHWDLPLALELEYGGFLDKQIVEHFKDYAELCFWEFGDRVKNWITTNEAWTYTAKGYAMGQFPPGRGASSTKEAMAHAVETLRHRSLAEVYDTIGSAPIGIIKEIESLTKSIIPSALKDMASLLHVDDFIKNMVSDLLKTDCPAVVQIIKDFLISFQTDYKSSGTTPSVPVGKGDAGTEPYIVAHNIILAHANAVKLYRDKFQAHQGGKIGMTNNINYYVPYDENSQDDVNAAKRAMDFMFYWFVEPIVTGKYPVNMINSVGKNLPRFTPEEEEIVKGSFDFIGVNYYTTYYAVNLPKYPHAPGNYMTDQEALTTPTKKGEPIGPPCSGWLYSYPKGIYLTLHDLKEKFKGEDGQGPVIYITENGADEELKKDQTVRESRHDPHRVSYQNDHVWYMKKAIDEGVKVKAYFIWSFADNFEWGDGYSTRFGIFYVDFTGGRYARYPKDSALWWAGFMHNALELELPDSAKDSTSSSLKRQITNGEEEQENDPKKRRKTGNA